MDGNQVSAPHPRRPTSNAARVASAKFGPPLAALAAICEGGARRVRLNRLPRWSRTASSVAPAAESCAPVDRAAPFVLATGAELLDSPADCSEARVLDAEAPLRPRSPPRRRWFADVVGEPSWLFGAVQLAFELARLDVALTAAGNSTSLARTPCSRAAHGASGSGGGGAAVVGLELVDLLIKPRQMLLDFSTFSLKRVDDLLNTRQRRLLIERGLVIRASRPAKPTPSGESSRVG